jgi:hypothetical protein
MARPKRDELALAQAAAELCQEDGQQLAFTTSFLAQVSLPYRNPGDVPVWHRRNGRLLLTVQPGYITDPATGKPRSMGYPSGVIPRQLLFWIITEAKRTKSSTLILGDGVVEFFRELNPDARATGGKTGSLTRLRTQSQRLFGASIRVQSEGQMADGERAVLTQDLSVAHRSLLWGDGSDNGAVVQLSKDFYDELLERAVPLDLGALRLLGDNAWAIDLYTWLTHRFSYLRWPTTVSWDELNDQFGSSRKLETKEARYKFRKAFEGHLKRVLTIYRDANVEATSAGLVLRPSLTHVRFKGMRALEGEQLMLGDGTT